MSHKLYCGIRRGIALLLCILMLSTASAVTFAEEAHEHNFQVVEAAKIPPTCTQQGYIGYACACGEGYWDVVEPLGHEWSEGVVYQQPTPETDGVMVYQCSRCGEVRIESIPATGKSEPLPEKPADDNTEKPAEEPDEPELPESDPTVDLEAAPIWEAPFRGLMLTGDWRKDLVTIAWTQNGYEESEDNFEMVPKAGGGYTKNGYTRYGAWYGYPYGDWCAMFISFCLYYAGIPKDVFPYGHEVEDWLYALADKGYCVPAAAYTPKAGDLVFLASDQSIDHVGIVCTVDESADLLRTFEGNRTSKVETFDYSLKDSHIVGYAVLPDNPNPQPHPVLPDDETATAEEQPSQSGAETGETGEPAQTETDDMVLTGESDAGSFKADEPVPAGTELLVVSVPTSDAVAAVIRNAVAEEMQADPEDIFVTGYQVALKQPNGTASNKGADVTLKTAFPLPAIPGRTAQVKKTLVAYSSENGTLTTLNAQAKTENGVITSVSFHAPEAATYVICVALSFTEAEPESPAETTSGGATGGSEQQTPDQQVAEENSIPAGTLVQCDAGSFKADEPVPEGTQLMAVSVSTSDAAAAAISNAVAEEMQANPEEIFVTAYQVALVQPNGAVSSKGADVTLKTAFPLPTIPGRTAQVKKTLAAYSSADGAFKTLSAQAKTENGVITSVSFHVPEAGIYTICVALSFTEAEPESPAETTSGGAAAGSGQQTQGQQAADENSIPAGTLVQCDAGSFKADKAVPEGTQLIASETVPNKVVTWTIQNFIQKYIAASEPEEIAVTAYQVVLVSPDGNIQPSAAEVTLKTALPLPTVQGETAGVVRNTQVKDIVAVYASEVGVLHVYRANAQTQGNVITSVAFYAPESAVYAICYTLKISE